MLKYIPFAERRRESIYREFSSATTLEAQLNSIETWVGHTRRHLDNGDMRMAMSAFWQIGQTVDVVHTRLTDLANAEREVAEAAYTEQECYVRVCADGEHIPSGWMTARISDEHGRLHRVRVRWDKTGRTSEVINTYVEAFLTDQVCMETLHAARTGCYTSPGSDGVDSEQLVALTVRRIARDGETMWDQFSDKHKAFCRFVYKDLKDRGLIDSVPLAHQNLAGMRAAQRGRELSGMERNPRLDARIAELEDES